MIGPNNPWLFLATVPVYWGLKYILIRTQPTRYEAECLAAWVAVLGLTFTGFIWALVAIIHSS